MHTDTTRRARLGMMAAACFAALAAGACKKANNADTGRVETPPADTGATGMAPADTTGAAATNTKYTDANIVALLDEANKGDSAAGAFALGKAKDPGVKAFAKMMMRDHHALRVQGEALAKKLNVTPEPPANDPVKTAGDAEMQALSSAGTGAGFDRTYIDQAVTIHKAVIDLADQAHSQTQNAELKALIEKAKPTIQKHLDKAEELQKTLGKTTT